MKLSSIVLAAILLGACAQIPIVIAPAQSDYDRALYHARQNVDAGNYWAADRLLEEFARTHPGTKEAGEIAFWKAAYMVDPANNLGSLAGGIAALDSYLASDSSGWYRNEAIVLRRTAAAAQGPSVNLTATAAPASTTATTDTVVVVSKSREDEIASLKDQLAKSKEELAKVSAELDRIKKRLANPSN
jgi:hypothetical protein